MHAKYVGAPILPSPSHERGIVERQRRSVQITLYLLAFTRVRALLKEHRVIRKPVLVVLRRMERIQIPSTWFAAERKWSS